MNIAMIGGYIKTIYPTRETKEGSKVVDILVAVKSKRKKQDGAGQLYDYFKCTCWNYLAEYVLNLSEGIYVDVIGSVAKNSYDDKDGKKVYDTYINVTDIQAPMSGEGKEAKEEFKSKANQDGYIDVNMVNSLFENEANPAFSSPIDSPCSPTAFSNNA